MTGDGVNDSPALKRADVGIAVFGATDAAKAAADIVLTEAGLSTIVEGILISRRIWCRVRSFLTYRIAATLQLLCFFFLAVFFYRPNEYMPKNWQNDPEFMDTQEWPPFFHMPVLMLMLITLLNDGTLITIGYDLAVAPRTPPKWNMPFLFSMAFVPFFVAKPARILLCGAMVALSCSTCFAMFWPKSYPDGIQTEGLVESPPYMLEVFVWSWSLSWWLVEDAAKVLCRWIVHKYNIFDINNTGMMQLTPKAQKAAAEMRANKDKQLGGHH